MLKLLTATALVAGALAGAANAPAQSSGDATARSADTRLCIYLSWPPRLCSLRS